MNSRSSSVRKALCYAATVLLMAAGTSPLFAQQGIVNDWSTHHVIFSNPGTEMDALMNGRRVEWQQLVSNPRYQMQQVRRSAAWANRFAAVRMTLQPREDREPGFEEGSTTNSMQRDWTSQIAPTGSGTALGMFPALFANSYTVASCSDYILFPVNVAGKSGTGTGQANFVGFNNLYKTTCTGTVPTVGFAYYVGTGVVQTSPVLSEDGTKVAFVESVTNGSNLHVFTLGTTGGNGTGYTSPAVPKTIVDNGTTTTTTATNNATDRYITLSGSVSVTRSSPYIDYTNDVAYVGDDSGVLHKFTGVFKGTLAEVKTGGWPFTVVSGSVLSSPVLDSTSGNILVSGAGNMYCIVASTAKACATASVNISNGSFSSGAALDAPIVDSTAGKVFSEAVASSCSFAIGSNCFGTLTTESVLMQATTSLGSVVRADMGDGGTNLHNGDFDNIYYSSTASTGHMYFCGNLTGASTPELYRVTITAGTMSGATPTSVYQLVATGSTGTTVSCAPLTEVYNGTTDYMFLGVQGHGNPTGCETSGVREGCIMSFVIPSGGTVPTAPSHELSLGGNGAGTSGIVIDNVSTQTGASQIYFSNLESGDATQASQSGLQ